MKKIVLLLVVIIPFITNCKKENDIPFFEIKEIAWNSLSNQLKETVIIDWRLALVQKSNYNQKVAYLVTFKTSLDQLLGPITVFIDASTKTVLGQGIRD